MQSLVLEKTIPFKDKVQELVQVSIDDNIDYLSKSDGILLNGKIYLNGEVKIKGELVEFLDTLDIDIYAPFDQLVDKRALQFKVEDFEFKIIENKIQFLLKVAIDGWSDVKSTFPAKKPYTKKESKKGSVEAVNDIDVKVTSDIDISLDVDVNELEVEMNKKIDKEESSDYAYADLNDSKTSKSKEKDKAKIQPINGENIDITPLKKALKEQENKVISDVLEAKAACIEDSADSKFINEIDKVKKQYNIDSQDQLIKKNYKNELLDQLNKDVKIDDKVKKDLSDIINDLDEDIIVVDKHECEIKEYDVNEKKLEEALLEILESKHPFKIIEEEPIKVESKNLLDDEKSFDYFNLFRNNRKSSTVFWRYRVVLKDDTYSSISAEVKVAEKKIVELNHNKPLECGTLIKIPL